jgi:hypothetical protein
VRVVEDAADPGMLADRGIRIHARNERQEIVVLGINGIALRKSLIRAIINYANHIGNGGTWQ